MVKCKEDYDTLRTSLQNVIKEVNSLSKEKVLEVDGKQLKIQLYLGGDYKVNKSRQVLTCGFAFFNLYPVKKPVIIIFFVVLFFIINI